MEREVIQWRGNKGGESQRRLRGGMWGKGRRRVDKFSYMDENSEIVLHTELRREASTHQQEGPDVWDFVELHEKSQSFLVVAAVLAVHGETPLLQKTGEENTRQDGGAEDSPETADRWRKLHEIHFRFIIAVKIWDNCASTAAAAHRHQTHAGVGGSRVSSELAAVMGRKHWGNTRAH